MASPETIRVRAVAGVLVQVPGQACMHGGQAQYVGRRNDHVAATRREKDLELLHPIDDGVNATFLRSDGPGVLAAIRKALKDGDLLPVDATTANWAAVPIPDAPSKPTADTEDSQ